MFNPIIVPCRNNLQLTRKALKTFQAQDIDGGVYILVIDNASTDGTNDFLRIQRDIATMTFDPSLSVAESWNRALSFVFRAGAEYALVVNNDVELRPETYRKLVEENANFVTAVGVRKWPEDEPSYGLNKRPHPDFSCFCIRRHTFERVGDFDENFLIAFCEDGDYDLRMYRSGIRAYCIDLPFLHHGSMTIKNAELPEIRRIQAQAEKNREYFKRKWGFAMASDAYYNALDKGGPGPDSAP